jgi:hypothetical protein
MTHNRMIFADFVTKIRLFQRKRQKGLSKLLHCDKVTVKVAEEP